MTRARLYNQVTFVTVEYLQSRTTLIVPILSTTKKGDKPSDSCALFHDALAIPNKEVKTRLLP